MTLATFARRALALAVLAAPLVAMADERGAYDRDRPAENGRMMDAEIKVMAHLHRINLLEIDLGHLAQTNTNRDAVRDYGRMLVRDHTKSDNALLALAKRRGVIIPTDSPVTDADRDEQMNESTDVDRLHQLHGTAFDNDFLPMMVKAHEKEGDKLSAEIGQVEDKGLSAILVSAKPVFKHHADEARRLMNSNPQARR
jgi:putative membrane protein